jgi:CRISP-associated protein Cas1
MQLYLNKPGCSISVRDGQFCVRVKDTEDKFIAISQVKTIHLNRAVRLSAEVIWMVSQNDIDMLFVERSGKPFARIWSNRFGSIATIRKNQAIFANSTAAVEWIKALLLAKMEQQELVLTMMAQVDQFFLVKKPIEQLQQSQLRMRALTFASVAEGAATIRGVEANASKVFFRALSTILPNMYRFENRSQHPAMDMFNGLLNYAYGMLYGKVESALIKAGVDPSIGVFHADEYNRPVLVYDVIEQFRGWADFVVTNLCMQQVIYPDFFDVENGAYYLSDMGKRILIQAFTDYLDEVIVLEGLERSRHTHIDLAGQRLAAMFKKVTNSD